MFREALNFLRQKQVLPTVLSSAELRRLDADVRQRAFFSARNVLDMILEDEKAAVENLLSGKWNEATARQEIQLALDRIGYDPQKPVSEEIPPAEVGSLQDLSSDDRVRLVLETNFRQAANYGHMQQGNEPEALYLYPAYELVRIYDRMVPRGFRRTKEGIIPVPEDKWETRWLKAAQISGDTDATRILAQTGKMIARKDSPIWAELGSSENFDDALDTSFPPYAFNSGKGWRDVPRDEAIALGLVRADEVPEPLQDEFNAGLDADALSLGDLEATRDALLAAADRYRAGGDA